MSYVILALAIFAETIGTTALQTSAGFSRFWPSFIVVLAYALAFFLLGHSLKYFPVGIAYALWSGLGIVLITAIGWFFFNQKLDLAALVGIALILSGIIVLHLFSQSGRH